MRALGKFSARIKWGLLVGLISVIGAAAFLGCSYEGKALQEKLEGKHKIVAYGVTDPQISAQQHHGEKSLQHGYRPAFQVNL